MEPVQALLQILPAERVKTSLVDRMAFAGDAGFYQLIPVAVVFPENENEVAALFRFSRSHTIPLVFRAAGTSLSGQAITDGILVEVGRYWRKAQVLDNGNAIKVQPGVTGAAANYHLAAYGRKIGPDPASINAAMMGGILSNNASGMCCGVTYNSYHTLRSVRIMLTSGRVYDTSLADDYARFERDDAVLFDALLHCRKNILAQPALLEKIRRKYRMKNTVGYSLNALVDYEHPLDILAHLMIGAEGTLGFISEAVLHTIPDLPFKSAAMLYFPGIYEACSAISLLKDAGAEALELMDRSALRSVEHLPGLPGFFTSLPPDAAAILCEFQSDTKAGLQMMVQKGLQVCAGLPLLHPPDFTSSEKERQFYWKIRKGMFPSVGAVRQRGSTVILEDIAFPVVHLADALIALRTLFAQFGYENAIIFGHAGEGNIHFVITQLLNSAQEIARYDAFMQEVVRLVLEKYHGTLKAEHGTGRNMAPFVEAEWGGEAYAIMQALKQAADPDNLLNPGVIINPDEKAHIKNLKQMPEVEAEVDKCIECGFCEHHCPSKDVTLTPRQRIQVRRHLQLLQQAGASQEHQLLLKEYQYAGLDTCATDGLCQMDCPVSINTGELVKRLRNEQHGTFSRKAAMWVAVHFGFAEKLVRVLLHGGTWLNRIFGRAFMPRVTGLLRRVSATVPRWWPELGAPPARRTHHPQAPQYVYLSACIQRMMGNDTTRGSIQDAMLQACERAGISLLLPAGLPGHCCGQAFSSKGFFDAARYKQEALVKALWQWTSGGKLPVVCDFTSCTYTLLKAGPGLDEPYRSQFAALTIMDSIPFLRQVVVKDKKAPHPLEKVVLHPGCAATKMQLSADMEAIAAACSHKVVIPREAGCCGMAGDRGFLFPELTKGATAPELEEAVASNAAGYYASAKTCEMALTHFSGKPYRHIVHLINETA